MSHIFNKLGTLQDTTYNNEEKFFGWLYLIHCLMATIRKTRIGFISIVNPCIALSWELRAYFIIVINACFDDLNHQSEFSNGNFCLQFCRPIGWTLSAHRQPPEFFVAVLTDIDADRHYLSVLTFSESVAISPTKSDDGDTEEDSALTIHSLMYSPKCLVLVSRLDYFETFKVCSLLTS